MPGLRHDGLVALVRQHPPLAVDLVRLMEAYPLPDDVVAVLGSEDMTDQSCRASRDSERAASASDAGIGRGPHRTASRSHCQ